jgi:SPX domain protein involved in polyphosphate accumulation
MAIEVFNRYENKYLLDSRTTVSLQRRIMEHMEPDAFNRQGRPYTISNIYYDTTDSQLIRTSLQKPTYKEKLRLRSYGVPDLDTLVYLEIKKKYQGLVNKRRSKISLADAYHFVATKELPREQPSQNRQVLREIAYILQQHDLQPQLYLAYDRRAYFDRADKSLRISFDTNIRCRRTELRLEAGDWGDQLLDQDQWLMEVKTAANMPFWLARLLSEHQVLPVSFSKYGTEYQQLLAERSQPELIRAMQAKPQTISAKRGIIHA